MRPLTTSLKDLSEILAAARTHDTSLVLVCRDEMISASTLILAAGRLNSLVSEDIELSIANALVGLDCAGIGLSTWVPELNERGLQLEARRLERALLEVHQGLVELRISKNADHLDLFFL